MSRIEKIADRYLAVWNEADPGRRRKEVGEIWAEDGLYANTSNEFLGHDGIEAAVREAHEEFVAAGFTFRLKAVAENHDAARIGWEMVPSGGGDPVAAGTQYLVFAADDRIRTDYQFPD
ncbi:conserved hypothetical protein [Parafrankia sp. EAN1pec]|uniref:nuclear transport factor 2 family protein n=1 Tax=Parafrankia sp. (strain EAN1pec) TaxID=298653 RepID=UPI0000544971|nr:conserved hypothetical protein [Frankia sp. EAN1pec]